MAETPNFLGFASLMPKQSPLERAITGGVEMYGKMQQFKAEKTKEELQEESLAQQKMITKEMPSMLERERKESEQKLGIGQQDLKLKQLAVQFAPEEIRTKLTGEQLDNAIRRTQNVVANMDIEDVKHNHVLNDLADVADMQTRNPDVAAKMYQSKRKTWLAMGENPENIPPTFDKNAQTYANFALAHTPAAAAERSFQNELTMQRVKNEGLITSKIAGKADSADKYIDTLKEQSAKEDIKYRTDTNKAAIQAMTMKKDVDEMLSFAQGNPSQFGYLSGRTMVLNEAGQKSAKAAAKLYLDLFSQMPHIGRGSNLLMQKIEEAKATPHMTKEAYEDMAKSYAAEANYRLEKNNFVNEMKEKGVTDQNDLETSWANFENNSNTVDEKRHVHPEVPGQWREYYANNPQALPKSLLKRIKMQNIAKSNNIDRGAPTIPGIFEQNKEQQPQPNKTMLRINGTIQPYNGQSPKQLLTGE